MLHCIIFRKFRKIRFIFVFFVSGIHQTSQIKSRNLSLIAPSKKHENEPKSSHIGFLPNFRGIPLAATQREEILRKRERM